MWSFFVILVLILSFVFGDDLVVEVKNGKVKGYERITFNNVTYYSFLGIPFAQPPIGDLRFQAPKPAQNWDDVLDVKSNSKFCYQYSTDEEGEDENCLYLNVFTPVRPGENASLPVLASIYGGAFQNGRATSANARLFIEQDIIVVNFNYRVGIFGFLSTMDETIPGNFGLKDQYLALKWIQDNIHLFGGDPTKVTLNGQSAGGASVTFHYLNPKSGDLFRGGISESGSVLNNFAHAPDAKNIAYQVGNSLNGSISENNTSSGDLLEFLRTVSAKDLDAVAAKMKKWGPVVEVEHEDAFITEPMYEAVEQGHINKKPLIIGFNSEECIVSKGSDLEKLNSTMIKMDEKPGKLVNLDMNIVHQDSLETVGLNIRNMYTEGLFQNDLGAAIKYYSDNDYTKAITKYAKLHAQYADCYFYMFFYKGPLGVNNVTVEGADNVAHGEEKSYLWINDKLDFGDYPESDKLTSDRFSQVFIQFIKNLNPTPETSELIQNITWPKITQIKFPYLEINTDLSIKENPRGETFKNWESLYDKNGVRPFTTY